MTVWRNVLLRALLWCTCPSLAAACTISLDGPDEKRESSENEDWDDSAPRKRHKAKSKDAPASPAEPVVVVPPESDQPELPAWVDGRPRSDDAPALFGSAVSQPAELPFAGMLVCRISAEGRWDDAVPFVGPASATLPDLTLFLEGYGAGWLPADQSGGLVTFAKIEIASGDSVAARIEDRDTGDNDVVATFTLSTKDGFPLQARSDKGSVECRGVSAGSLDRMIEKRRKAVAAALKRMKPNGVRLGAPDLGRRLSGISEARGAVTELAALASWSDEGARAAAKEIGRAERGWEKAIGEAFDAAVESGGTAEGWAALPSAKVRADAKKRPLTVRLQAGPVALRYNWHTLALGKLHFELYDARGTRAELTFVNFERDGVELEDLNPKIEAKTEVDVRLSPGPSSGVRYVAVREGNQRVYLRAAE